MDFGELIEFSRIQGLFDHFATYSGVASAILDLEGNIYVAAGWKDLCTRFHRTHPESALCCKESDTALALELRQGHTHNVYRCKNGLMDVAVPVMVSGEHIANFYIGQFFLEEPDIAFFEKQAEKYGFDKTEYLDALGKIPIYSEEHVHKLMNFLTGIIELFGESLVARKRVEDIREQLILELKESETKIKTLSGLLPICSSCKKIRNGEGSWERFESYVQKRSEAEFSHSICPDCVKILYPEYIKEK